ncbi:MAG: hypothetical protein FJY77_00805 [Candidatus Altiarchaeales archaeon]|nr:hypothetical protein [Candidatus Altiarchaeales archaeon]
MKLDHILLMVVGIVILLILLGLGVGVLMILSGGEEGGGGGTQPSTVIKYQCFDGKVVSQLSDCPKVSTLVSSVSTAVTSVSCPVTTRCPLVCDCITRPTTSPPTTLCIHCTSASSCGAAYSESICKAGESGGVDYDVWEMTYTPACSSGCCIWTSSRTPKAACLNTETCINGTCVLRPDTSGE